ncbi:unnamed protein product [Urochloa humidicola]
MLLLNHNLPAQYHRSTSNRASPQATRVDLPPTPSPKRHRNPRVGSELHGHNASGRWGYGEERCEAPTARLVGSAVREAPGPALPAPPWREEPALPVGEGPLVSSEREKGRPEREGPALPSGREKGRPWRKALPPWWRGFGGRCRHEQEYPDADGVPGGAVP